MRTADNRVDTILSLYGSSLAGRYPAGEVRAIVRAVFHHQLGWDTAQLELRRDAHLSESELLRVYDPLQRLRAGEPLQYVLGLVHFHGLDLKVGPGVLIPRPETEEMVDRIIHQGMVPKVITDIGTGSGCIALALKRAFPQAQVHGIDVSTEALAIARRNAERNGLEAEWHHADVLDAAFTIPPGTDLIVSNPPYVPRGEKTEMSEHVHAHEPDLALFVDDDDPLRFHRVIGVLAYQALPPAGQLWFEGHKRHAHAVGDLLHGLGFAEVNVMDDLGGLPRFIHAVRP